MTAYELAVSGAWPARPRVVLLDDPLDRRIARAFWLWRSCADRQYSSTDGPPSLVCDGVGDYSCPVHG